MPGLPNEAFTLTGGCDCRSIRYKISIPPLSSRPIKSKDKETGNEARHPQIFLDHCNKCRRVSGAIIQAWLTCPQSWVCWQQSPSFAPSDRYSDLGFSIKDTKEFISTPILTGLPVRNYTSSPGIMRSFCGRCGTNLAYVCVDREEEGEVPSVDIVLGSLDTESLEMEGVRPDRHFYWDSGVSWVKRLVTEGDEVLGEGERLPRHPDGSRSEAV